MSGGIRDEAGNLIGPERVVEVPVLGDSTYLAELTPGFIYELKFGRLAKRSDGRETNTVQLQEGEVLFLQAPANGVCP